MAIFKGKQLKAALKRIEQLEAMVSALNESLVSERADVVARDNSIEEHQDLLEKIEIILRDDTGNASGPKIKKDVTELIRQSGITRRSNVLWHWEIDSTLGLIMRNQFVAEDDRDTWASLYKELSDWYELSVNMDDQAALMSPNKGEYRLINGWRILGQSFLIEGKIVE